MKDKLEKQAKKQKEILEQIDKIEQPYRLILEKVYILGETLVKVANDLEYDYKHMCYMNGIALKKFEELDK